MGRFLRLSYHASFEQHAPSALLRYVTSAEDAGFDSAFASDHLQPWSTTQGHSGLSWVWLGAALQATQQMSFSTIMVPGAWRYRPVIVAQALATLAEMYPGRVPWVALGTGQALSECVGGETWLPKPRRNARLWEALDLIRRLLAGERVTQEGSFPTKDALIWERPARTPRLVVAAAGDDTARWAGSFAEGLLTAGIHLEALKRRIASYREGGGGGMLALKLDLSWAATESDAMRAAHAHWRFNALGSEVNTTLRTPQEFEAASRHLTVDDMRDHVLPVTRAVDLATFLRRCADLGFDTVNMHHVGPDQLPFLDWCGRDLIPLLDR